MNLPTSHSPNQTKNSNICHFPLQSSHLWGWSSWSWCCMRGSGRPWEGYWTRFARFPLQRQLLFPSLIPNEEEARLSLEISESQPPMQVEDQASHWSTTSLPLILVPLILRSYQNNPNLRNIIHVESRYNIFRGNEGTIDQIFHLLAPGYFLRKFLPPFGGIVCYSEGHDHTRDFLWRPSSRREGKGSLIHPLLGIHNWWSTR